MAKALTFSVGIPAFNQGDYLEETILSLLNQTRPPDEIVISDHYSTDNTPEIIEKYAKHVRGVKPPPGVNISGQWNFTFSSLSGDWVTLLSSDDIAKPNFCETLLRGAGRRDDAVMVYAGWEQIDEKGGLISKEYLLSVKHITLPPANLVEQRNGPKASFAAFAVKREALNASGGYPEGFESFGDWPLYVQIAPFGSFIYENEIVSGYRLYDENKFHRRIGMWLRDEERMFYEVFPRAAERANMADRSWIDEASRRNFIRYLSAAGKEFPMEDRTRIAPLFNAWAARLGAEDLVERFAAGESISAPVSFVDRGKNLIRPLAKRLTASLRG